jgi:putative MFS transporter
MLMAMSGSQEMLPAQVSLSPVPVPMASSVTVKPAYGAFSKAEAGKLVLYSAAASCLLLVIPIGLYGFWSTSKATAAIAAWMIVAFVVFAFVYETLLADEISFCIWYTMLLCPTNALTAMVIVYSAEVFPTEIRSRGTGLVSGLTKIAGVVAPLFVTLVIETRPLYHLSIMVCVPLLMGTLVFFILVLDTRNLEADIQVGVHTEDTAQRA